jgi:hypothetical protein
LRELQERLDAGTKERHRITVEAAFLRVGFHRLAHEFRHTGKLRLAVDRQREGLLVGKHILAECGPEFGQAFDDLGQPFLRCAVERGAGAAEGGMVALQHARLLGGEVKLVRLPHDLVEAAKQRRIGTYLVPVTGDLRRDLALDLQEGLVAVGADKKVEDVFDPRQRLTAQLQRRDGVAEARRLRQRGDGGDLGLMLGKRVSVGRREVLGPDGRKRRNPVGGRPMLEKRVVGRVSGAH